MPKLRVYHLFLASAAMWGVLIGAGYELWGWL
jgi:hypothetical protein